MDWQEFLPNSMALQQLQKLTIALLVLAVNFLLLGRGLSQPTNNWMGRGALQWNGTASVTAAGRTPQIPHQAPRAATPSPPSLGVVLARHAEDVRWLARLAADWNDTGWWPVAAVHAVVYQTPGREVEEDATLEDLAAAEAMLKAEDSLGGLFLEQQEGPARADSTPGTEEHDSSSATAGRRRQQQRPGMSVSQRLTPMNRGHEAMAYLTAIIQSYASLPDLTVFIHAHRHSNHTHLVPDWVLRRLALRPPNPEALPGGYMSLQCKEEPRDWSIIFLNDTNATEPGFRREHMANILQAWDEGLGEWLGNPPDTLLTPPNAEFILTRAAIRSRPLEFYQAARRWLMVTPLRSFIAGMVMEYLWQLIFTGEAVAWATQEECMCRLYGICSSL